jgi:CubicO group peptidase (beta-lactamase class C family)
MADDLPTASPADVHLDAGRLDALNAHIATAWPGVTSLLVARHGRVVTERYFGIAPGSPQDIQSVTKSVVSLLVGVALARGDLRHLDQPVLPLLPREQDVITDPRWHAVPP